MDKDHIDSIFNEMISDVRYIMIKGFLIKRR